LMDQCTMYCAWILVHLEVPFSGCSTMRNVNCCSVGMELRKIAWMCWCRWIRVLAVIRPEGIRACNIQEVEHMFVIMYRLGTVY